jgi:hypothetical protein
VRNESKEEKLMQVAWMYNLLMASPSNKVRGVVWEEGNSLGAVTIWMMTPDSFLVEHEFYRKDSNIREWMTLSYREVDPYLESVGLNSGDHAIWRIIQ